MLGKRLRCATQLWQNARAATASVHYAGQEALASIGYAAQGAQASTAANTRPFMTGASAITASPPRCKTAVFMQQFDQRRSMFIQTQSTPNPLSLMFIPGQSVMGPEGGTKHFGSSREGLQSPLAKRLFMIDGVSSVFFGSDFVTVTKSEDYSWAVLKPDIFAAIMDHFAGGEPLLLDSAEAASSDTAIHEDDDEVVAMIKELLETRIRPAVRDDGGDIVYMGFDPDSGTVWLKMQGACSGCPSSSVTLKSGIENMLMHYVPEVRQVLEAPPDEGESEGIKAFNNLEAQLSN